MIGEWFYVAPGETIAIFSAEHDKFVTMSYEEVKKHDVRLKPDGSSSAEGVVSKTDPNDATQTVEKASPILIFRPFQTVSLRTIFCCVYTITPLTLNDSFLPTLP